MIYRHRAVDGWGIDGTSLPHYMGYPGISSPIFGDFGCNLNFREEPNDHGCLGLNYGISPTIVVMIPNAADRGVDAGTSTAPYLSFPGLVKALDRLADGALPARLEPTIWPSRQLGSRVMQGLRYLRFVAPDGQPMLALLGYIKEGPEQRLARLRTAVSSAYDWALRMPPDTSLEQLLTAFESYGNVHGEDRRRAANFLIQAAKELQLPFAFKPQPRGRPPGARDAAGGSMIKPGGLATSRRTERHFDTLLDLLESAAPENEVDYDLLDRMDRLAAKSHDQLRLDRYFDFLISHVAGRGGPNRRVLDSLDRLHSL
jgi:hypothetical protein